MRAGRARKALGMGLGMLWILLAAGCVSSAYDAGPQARPPLGRAFCTDPMAPGCSPGAEWTGGMGP